MFNNCFSYIFSLIFLLQNIFIEKDYNTTICILLLIILFNENDKCEKNRCGEQYSYRVYRIRKMLDTVW